MEQKTAAFAYHPLVDLLYFSLVIGASMVLQHPVCFALSLLGAAASLVCLCGRAELRRSLRTLFPILMLTTLVNPLFNHRGVTILMYLPSGNPLTLESICYGLGAGVMLCAVLLWFRTFGEVMTSDKFIYLFGRIIPALSLLLSMTLRLVPKFKHQLREIESAQRGNGRDITVGSVWQRTRLAASMLSVLVSWALEDAIETADSMRSRGYGLPGRTAFSLYTFRSRDRAALCCLLVIGTALIVLIAAKALTWQWFPAVYGEMGTAACFALVLYALLLFAPVFLSRKEMRRWNCSH